MKSLVILAQASSSSQEAHVAVQETPRSGREDEKSFDDVWILGCKKKPIYAIEETVSDLRCSFIDFNLCPRRKRMNIDD